MRYCFCMVITLLFVFAANSQKNVRIEVLDPAGQPIQFATVTVKDMADSLLQFEKVSDSMGNAFFSLMEDKFYTVWVSSVNFHQQEKRIIVKGEQPHYVFQLQALSGTLNQVVIRATKPLLRQEDDKTIVDPESLAAASSNAFETIEKAPGLFIDPDGNIYISSTTPATVYINGREQRMSAADVASLLKSLPPNAIASIEILRTPSARYDASGSGGIVNVILRKGVRIGLTGSVYSGFQQGKYGNRFAGFNINNSSGKITSYLNLNFSGNNSFERISTDRIFTTDSILSQDAITRYHSGNFYMGYGISYEINKKWELGYDGRFSFNNSDNSSINESSFEKISTGSRSGQFSTLVNNEGKRSFISQGLNIKYKIDSVGSEWTTDLSFNLNGSNARQSFSFLQGDISSKPRFFSAQSNFIRKLPAQFSFETGLKTTQVWFRNHSDYFRLENGSWKKDDVLTRFYKYQEAIHAAYLQLSKTMGKLVIKAGTRMENTNMKGSQYLPSDTSFSLHRTDFFPYVYISRKIMSIAGFDLRAYLVYRKTINRPGYDYLNPSIRFIDPFLFETGNPSLRPQFTHNYEANISVDERPIMAIGFNDTKDIFTQVIYPSDTSSKVSYRTYDNLGSNKETYIRMLGAIPPGGKYFFVAGAQYNHNFYRGLYQNKPLSFKRGTWTIFTYHSLKITPLTQFTMSGFARFKGQQQFYELGSFGELRMSLNQQFFKRKLAVTLSVGDIFRTNRNEFYINQGGINATGFREADTRRFGFNLRYNFGIRKKEENQLPSEQQLAN